MNKVLFPGAATILCGLVLASCGGSKGAAPVGVSVGVSLSSPSNTTLVPQNTTIEIDASTPGDTSGKGVSWMLTPSSGAGSIASSTPSKAIYQAPTAVAGALLATLTATSNFDNTKYASVTLTVNGSPAITPPVLFPANQGVLYAAYISVAGGTPPYAWTATGTLPPGLAPDGSTSATVGIVGTPTAVGTYTFGLTVTDATKATASVSLTQIVNPPTACLLVGSYAYMTTGFRGGLPAVRAGSVTVSATGTVTGVYDYKDASGARAAAAVSSGTCTTVTANRGVLSMTSASGGENFDFGAVGTFAAGQLEQDDGSGIIDSGQFFRQPATPLTQAALAGDWVFGMVGDSGAKARLAVVGRMTLDANGVISNGVADNDATPAAAAAALSGTLTAPDANGRGTGTLSYAGQSLPVAYYVIDSGKAFVVSNDTTANTPRLAGQMTRQSGAGALGAAAFSSPSVLSLWGSSYSAGQPVATMSAGLLWNAAPAAGAVDVLLDVSDRGLAPVNSTFPASPYAVAANGRATLSWGSGSASRSFVVYVDGNGGGYLLEPSSAVGNFGILQAQQGAPFDTFPTTYFVGGTLFAGATSPITLAPQLQFSNSSIGGNLTGSYAIINPAAGRMIATVTRTILGGTGLVIYIVSPQKIVIIGDGINVPNSALSWFTQY